jgi:hypothetical protein
MSDFTSAIRRRAGSGTDEKHPPVLKQAGRIRMSGTNMDVEYDVNSNGPGGLTDDNPNGRTGNDWEYPDWPRGYFVENQDPGDRLQDIANTHLSEGPNPGRIPRPWNSRIHGILGRGITGQPYNLADAGFTLGVTGNAAGGTGDAKYVPHTPTPRNMTLSRAYARTVDDAAPIPAVYVSDPTRR